MNIQSGLPSGDRVRFLRRDTEDLRIISRVICHLAENLDGHRPLTRLAQVRIERDVDTLLRPTRFTACVIEQHDIRFQVSVPMHRRAPERIRILLLPRDGGAEDRRHATASSGLAPFALEVFLDRVYGILPLCESHSRNCHALPREIATIIVEEKIEVLTVTVEDDGEIAVAARKEAILRPAVDRISRL